MFKFPEDVYSDVRIEDIDENMIAYTVGNLDQYKSRKYQAAFIRVFDGNKWFYTALTEIEDIQKELDTLSEFAVRNKSIYEHPVVKGFEANKGRFITFKDNDISKVSMDEKDKILTRYFDLLNSNKFVKNWKAIYVDRREVKKFYSSKGAELEFDSQRCGYGLMFSMAQDEKLLDQSYQQASNVFGDLDTDLDACKEKLDKCVDFMLNSKTIDPGKYTVILSPMTAGVFAHESFGHKSEADFQIGDENMKEEWKIGCSIGSEVLSIADDGNMPGCGFFPYDDEGTKARKTMLIENGALAGRLHSINTAVSLGEEVTGNARATSFEYEPIVRMTSTYILPGELSKEELFAGVKEGLYIEDLKHGSGMSTFTIAPSLSYRIRDGKISEPVNVSVLTGNVFETLGEIDAVSDTLEIKSFVFGGCGKMEQMDLPVSFGGPYVRINNMIAQ